MPVIMKPSTTAASHTPASSHQGVASFMKTGAQAKQAVAEADAVAEAQREASGRPLRFYIPKTSLKKDHEITFLDGDVDASGELDLKVWNEHQIELGGKITQVVCLLPDFCPACQAKDSTPDMVALFTVIDHTPYTFTKGPKQGTTEKDKRKLYVAKRNSLGILGKYAAMHKGLRGMRFLVSRTSDRSARVGDIMIPASKWSDEELMAMMGKDDKGERLDLPYNYVDIAPYFPAEKLQEMGIGSASAVIGNQPSTDLSHKL